MDDTVCRRLGVAGGVVGLAAVVAASAHPTAWVWQPPTWHLGPLPLPTAVATPQPDSGLSGTSATTSDVPRWIMLALGAIVAAALLLLLLRMLRRLVRALAATRLARVPPADSLAAGAAATGARLTPQQVTDVVDEALRRLDLAPTPADAVVLAWLAFEEAATRHGFARDPADTPTEFTVRLLADSAVPPSATLTLRAAYHRARFSGCPATPDDVLAARTALEHIARRLEAAP